MIEESQKSELENIKSAEITSIKEGSSTAVMEGFGTRFITPYALALGSSHFIIALLSTLPALLGNLFQLHTLRLLKRRKRKTIVFVSAFIQALFWLPLIALGIIYLLSPGLSSYVPILLLGFYSIMVICGSVGFPAWNSWMKDLIIKNTGKYFGTRNRIVNIIVTISMLTAGAILSFFNKRYVLLGFFIIFFIAMIGRLIASYLLKIQYEPSPSFQTTSYFSLKDFIKKITKNNFGIFVIFISLISFSVFVAGPFFIVYMLEDLKLTYLQFTLITISSVITTIIFMPLWGRLADKYGTVKVLKTTSIFISIIPFLWVITSFLQLPISLLLPYLILIEFFSGFAWSGFNLSSAIFIYDAISREKMAICTTYFNIINAIGAFIGAIIGGLIASFKFSIFNLNTLILIFLLSGILRMIITMGIVDKIKEVREVPDFEFKEKIKRKFKENNIFLWRYIGFKSIKIN